MKPMSEIEARCRELLEPPERKPRVRVWSYQWFGLPVLVLIPILSLFDVFGGTSRTKLESSGRLEASVEHPSNIRYGQDQILRIEVRNTTASRIRFTDRRG
jgi:hypothetical protein